MQTSHLKKKFQLLILRAGLSESTVIYYYLTTVGRVLALHLMCIINVSTRLQSGFNKLLFTVQCVIILVQV